MHGRYRGWQADHLRRTVQGRLSEVWGFKKLKSDILFRILNLYPQAWKIEEGLSPEKHRFLQAYAQGFNEGLRENLKNPHSLFKKFHYKPEDWQPVDSLALILLKSFTQTRKTFIQELKEEAIQKVHGKDLSYIVEETGTPWETTVLKEGEGTSFPDTSSLSPLSPLFHCLHSISTVSIPFAKEVSSCQERF